MWTARHELWWDDRKGSLRGTPGKLESLTKSHPPCSTRGVLASTRGACCQQRQKSTGILLPARGRQGAASLAARSLCPLEDLPLQHVPCLEESQSHREGIRVGTTITDFYSQHVSKRERTQKRASVLGIALPGMICSEPHRCYTRPRLPEVVAFSQYRRSQIWESE